MPRFTRITVAVPIVGVSVTHGLTNGGAPVTPDDYYIAPISAAGVLPSDEVHFSTVPVDTTFAYLTAGSTNTVSLVCRYQHSIIR